MSLIIGLLTFLLVLNSGILLFLILLQLPKKDAGAGIAFGGGATDALFGAGSGNALTKMTKYSATIFIGLALVLSHLNAQRAQRNVSGVEQELLKKQNAPSVLAPPAPIKTQLLEDALPAKSPVTLTTTLTNRALTNPTNRPALILTNKAGSNQTNSPPAAKPPVAPGK